MSKIIGCLGPRASFSHEAVLCKGGSSATIKFYRSFIKLVEAVSSGEINEAAMPVDNSEIGVCPGLDPIIRSDNGIIKIISELILPIRHCLIGNGAILLTEIIAVASKAEAISQCRTWLEKNLPNVEIIETVSTATAVEVLGNYPVGTTAIGSKLSAKLYGKQIITKDIQDNCNNATHFYFIAKDNHNPITGNDKTSLLFSLPNQQGSLYEALMPLAALGINMTKIVSCPSRKKLGDYIFWVDIDGHHEEGDVKIALGRLKLKTETLRILGSYPKYVS